MDGMAFDVWEESARKILQSLSAYESYPFPTFRGPWTRLSYIYCVNQ
jgi:hypothetical protein